MFITQLAVGFRAVGVTRYDRCCTEYLIASLTRAGVVPDARLTLESVIIEVIKTITAAEQLMNPTEATPVMIGFINEDKNEHIAGRKVTQLKVNITSPCDGNERLIGLMIVGFRSCRRKSRCATSIRTSA